MDDQTAEKFMRIEDDMAELGKQVTALSGTVDRLDSDFYNHGQDGFKTRLTKFIAKWEEREDGREKSSRRFRFIVTSILAIVAIMATVYVGLKANEQLQLHLLHFPQVFPQHSTGQVLANNSRQTLDAKN